MSRRWAFMSAALAALLALAPAGYSVITVEGTWIDSYPGLGIVAGNQFRVTYSYDLASYVGSQPGGLTDTTHYFTRGVDPGQEIVGDPISQQGNTKILELDVDTGDPGSPVYGRVTSADLNGDSIPDGAPGGPLRVSAGDELDYFFIDDWLSVKDALNLGSVGNKDANLMPLDWIFHEYFPDNTFELRPPTESELVAALNTVKDDPQSLVVGASNLAFALGGVTPGSQPGTGDVWGTVTRVIPEPATVTLLGVAGALGALIRRRRR